MKTCVTSIHKSDVLLILTLVFSIFAGATLHDDLWPLLRLLAIGPDPDFRLHLGVSIRLQSIKAFYGVELLTPHPIPS
jgi:hypothetical protein